MTLSNQHVPMSEKYQNQNDQSPTTRKNNMTRMWAGGPYFTTCTPEEIKQTAETLKGLGKRSKRLRKVGFLLSYIADTLRETTTTSLPKGVKNGKLRI